MIKKNDIICISSIDWDFIWQGHQEIMSTLAHNDNRVLFIENTGVRTPTIRDISRLGKRIKNYFKGVKGIRKESENLYIFSPVILPFPYSRVVRHINKLLLLSTIKKWMAVMDFADPIIWTFLPTGISLDIINTINKKIVLYYCIDNFTASSASAKKIMRTERKILKLSDLVFVTSENLYQYCSKYSDNVHLYPFGVNIDKFKAILQADAKPPQEMEAFKNPVIGYIGGVHKWIDQDLVAFIAKRNQGFSIVLVGPIQADISKLSQFKNIHFLGNKSHDELPHFVKYFTVAIIPYSINEYTKNVYPTKLNEYLSMGKPVVSTRLHEVLLFNQRHENIVYIGDTKHAFNEAIETAVKENSETLKNKRILIAQGNSWHARIEEMCEVIEKAEEIKKRRNETQWKENLLLFYRTSQKKLHSVVCFVILGCLFIFYTPILWFMAEPLKISEAPHKADAIVVFAGGVGESGTWGQSYEERVQYAVELYKNKFAEHLIFCSGYIYVFKEPLVMKAMAIALGVPENAILIEDKAIRTSENIKYVKDILEAHRWNEILLVSSPYHMKRSSLVFNKVARGIKVTYTPIPNSLFYSHPENDINGKKVWRRVTFRQIKGIVHEYLGILYYWWKGWI